MDYRRKVYHRNGNNEERIKEIRESMRVRSASKRISEAVYKKSERYRNREDVQNHIKNGVNIANGTYEEKCEFLNTLNKLLLETKSEVLTDTNIFEDLCNLALVFLKDDHPCIRAMCFHIIRKSLLLERHLVYLLRSHVDIYMVRAVDLQIENEQERIEAFKLITWMMKVYDGSKLKLMIDDARLQGNGKKYAFPKSVMQPIVSIALSVFQKEKSKGSEESGQNREKMSDKMSMPCVGLFLEFCLSEPDLILEMAGTDWMVRVLTGISTLSRRIVLLVSQVLVFWLDNPHIRQKADLHMVLEQIFAPLVEYGLFQKKDTSAFVVKRVDDNVYDVLENFKASFMVLLRSWPGLFACAAVGPNSSIIGTSPLRLLEYLGLGTVENENLVRIREIIVEMCCEFGDLPYASRNFESWDEALVFYKSMHLPDKYKSSIKNDFVIAQNDARMRNDVNRKRPTIDMHAAFRCLSTFVLINASLPQSLARLILAQPDSSSGLKASLLLADMLRNAPSHVPVGWRAPVLSMPTLVQSACESLIQSRASAAIDGRLEERRKCDDSYTFIHAQNAELVLHRFDQLNQSWIRSSTNSSTILKESDLHIFVPHMQAPLIVTPPKEKSTKRPTVPDLFEEPTTGKFSETVLEGPYDKNKLLLMDDFDDYDYSRNRGMSIDSMSSTSTSDLQNQDGSISWNQTEYFIEKLDGEEVEEIVKEFSSHSTQQFVANLIYYISPGTKKFIIEKQHVIVTKSLIRLILRVIPRFGDNLKHEYCAIFLRFIQHFRGALEDTQIFSARSLTYTTNMYYFAIIGSFTISQIGLGLLNEVGILHLYVNMINSTTRPEHVKVIIASLDYSNEGITRTILRKALTSSDEVSRKWTTRYLSVLASAELVNFVDWGVQLMLRQLTDESPKVVSQAIRLLNQWLPEYPSRNLKKIQWNLYGEAGEMLKPHLYAIEEEVLGDIEEVRELVRSWVRVWNIRFVDVIDEDFRATMFSIKRSMNGEFSRSSTDRPEGGVSMPIHLFAALASHEAGRNILVEENVCAEMLEVLHGTSSKNRDIKGALFGLASIASHDEGVAILAGETIPRIVKIAEEHGVLSVRGNAFLACVCISQSIEGAKRLAQFGWESNLHRFTINMAKILAHEESPVKRRNTHNRHHSVVDNNAKPAAKLNSKSRTRSHSESRIERPEVLCCSNAVGKLRHWSSDSGLREDLVDESEKMMMVSPVSIVIDGMDEYRMHSSSGATSRLSNERRRANTTNSNIEEESSLGTRSSTVARCIRDGLQIPREQLEAEGTLADTIKEFHFSCRLREKYHLAPFRSHAAMQINRNIGDPVRYIFMSKDEERNFANYRRQAFGDAWLFNELKKEELEDNSIKKTVSVVPLQTVALPAEVEIMCGNIFASKQRADTMFNSTATNDDIEDRGARGGYAKIDQVSHIQRHSKYRCFYCSEDEQTEYPHPDAVQLRREVLNQVDMMEIKDNPTKRLIGLRQHHEWLFKWPCLYADVLELLDEYRFKPHSRSFLQQIFYDALQL